MAARGQDACFSNRFEIDTNSNLLQKLGTGCFVKALREMFLDD
jgi:hypothetical protein